MSGRHVSLGSRIRSRATVPVQVLARLRDGQSRPSLTDLGQTFGTDKAGVHHYTDHYEHHLGHLRDEAFTLFEIGIGGYAKEGKGGASLRMWKAFFSRARVVGLDIQDKSFVDEPRISTYQGSQVDEEVLRRVFDDARGVGSEVRVVIDDGSHRPEHVRETFRIVFPWLPAGAVYVIEDTQTSYWPRYGGSTDRNDPTTSMGLVKGLVDGLNWEEFLDEDYEPTFTDRAVAGVHCYHNLVFIEKGRNEEGTNRHRIGRRVDLGRESRRLTGSGRAERQGADRIVEALSRELDQLRTEGRTPRVAVVEGEAGEDVAAAASRLPEVDVRRFAIRDAANVTHPALLLGRPFDVVIDDTGQADLQARRLGRFLYYARPGGIYLAPRLEELGADGSWPLADWADGLVERGRGGVQVPKRNEEDDDDLGLAHVISEVRREPSCLVVRMGRPVLAKLREVEVNRILAADPSRGRILCEVPGTVLESRCELRVSSGERPRRMPETFDVPPVFLREYADVVCRANGIVVQGDLILPDSFRHPRNPRLRNRMTHDLAPRFAELVHDRPVSFTDGSFFHLDNENSWHFGHVLTEVLSRTWGWQQAKAADPQLKALLFHKHGSELAAWERALYGAVGIGDDDLLVVDSPIGVQRLVSATPMLSQPKYVHPAVLDTWRTVGDVLLAAAPDRSYPERIFCSRRPSERRVCRNAPEVEDFFRQRGFAVVFPEDFTLPEQVAMFDHAEVVAGFSGSAMFSVFAAREPKHVVLVSPESYTATNEYLLASVRGDRLSISQSPSEIAQPESGWDVAAMRAGFTVDLDVEGPWLDEVLSMR